MSADTGVGPAMASGSQVCRGNWALLPITATRSAAAAASSTPEAIWPVRAAWLMRSMSKVCPPAKKRIEMPTRRPMSPVRVVKKALRAALEFLLPSRSHQWPISMNEQSPISSQPNSACSVLLAVTSTNIPVVNSDRAA